MQELEKILEEIDAHSIEFEMFGVSDDYISVGWVKEIIRKHMNDRWIPVEVTPPPMDGQRLQAIIKHHEWITDYDADWVPEEEKTRHPEYLEVCEIHNIGATWFYACKEDDYQNDVAYIDPLEDLANPVSEIIAWKPLPQLHWSEKEVKP